MSELAKIWSARVRPGWRPGAEARRARTTLMLVDDNRLLCAAMRIWLDREPGIEWVGEVTECEAARSEVAARRPDVVLLDLNMPSCSGFDLLAEFLADRPEQRVVMLSGSANRDLVGEALRRGAAGYITKMTPVQQIGELVRRAAQGEIVLCAESQAAMGGAGEPPAL